MRILHTSDWHAGKIWRRLDRLGELAAVLEHLARFIEREKIDLLLFSGDLFDAATPPAEAERLVFSLFRRIGAHCPVVVVAGNHDSSGRFEAWGKLASLGQIHVVPRLSPPEKGGFLEIGVRSGERACIAALPFVRPGELVGAEALLDDLGAVHEGYASRVGQVIERLCQGFRRDAVNLFLGHLFVDGAQVSGSERRLHIGDTWAVPPQSLPPRAHYIALGHLHRPQPIPHLPKARYAGSPLQLDFGEAGEEKSFCLVEAFPGRPARVETVPYEGGRELLDLEMAWEAFQREAPRLKGRGWIRLTLKLKVPEADLVQKVRRLCPDVVAVRVELPEPREMGKELRARSPLERYRIYYERRHGRPPPADLLEAFEKLYREACGETGP